MPAVRSVPSGPAGPALRLLLYGAGNARSRSGQRAASGSAQLAHRLGDALERPVDIGAERVLLHDVGPGGGRPVQPGCAQVGSVGGDRDGLEGLGGPVLYRAEQAGEGADGLLVELIQRAETAPERPQVDALAQIGEVAE